MGKVNTNNATQAILAHLTEERIDDIKNISRTLNLPHLAVSRLLYGRGDLFVKYAMHRHPGGWASLWSVHPQAQALLSNGESL